MARTPRSRRTRSSRSRPEGWVPGIGVTWRRRGPAYWWRRFLFSLGMLALVALDGGIIAGVAAGIDDHTARWVFLGITGVCVVASGAWLIRRRRLGRVDQGRAERKGLRETRWYLTAVRICQLLALLLAVTAIVASATHHPAVVRLVVGIVALIVGVVFVGSVWITGGAMLVAFAMTLGRELPAERQARERVAGRPPTLDLGRQPAR